MRERGGHVDGASTVALVLDACRKRVERAKERQRVLDAGSGGVAAAVRSLVDGRDLEAGTLPAVVAELAIAEAAMCDQGNANAAASLRGTLEQLDELLGLVPPSGDLAWFNTLDLALAITREGVDPRSAVGQALLADYPDGLITYHPPPGWDDTTPARITERAGGPLRFWPESDGNGR